MPKDTIDRAIKRGSGEQAADSLAEIRYEGYAPGGVAVLVDTMTDNKNRTVAEVRHAFSKYNGSLGTDGSVAYLFSKVGLLSYPPDSDETKIMEIALEHGADDIINNDDGSLDVLTPVDNFIDIKETLIAGDIPPDNAEITMYAPVSVTLEARNAETMLRLLEALDDIDDVQKVYSNADIADDILSQLS
jgi:YebC/PmpR family DNA-binding regulatory protein